MMGDCGNEPRHLNERTEFKSRRGKELMKSMIEEMKRVVETEKKIEKKKGKEFGEKKRLKY